MVSTTYQRSVIREFLVATHSALMWLQFDAQWRLVDQAVIGRGYHYGVAALSDGKRPADRFIAYRGGESATNQTTPRLTMYEKGKAGAFVPTGTIDVGVVGDVHQITYANGGLYITDTKHNTLIYHGLENNIRQRYVFGQRRRDGNHLNSIYLYGTHVIVMLHNLRRKESQLALLRHGLVKGFELEEVLSLWHTGCHNVVIDGEWLLYHASANNELMIVDLRRDSLANRIALSGLPQIPGWRGHSKGLSVTGGHWVVGISEEAERAERGTAMSYLAVLNRGSGAVASVIGLDLLAQRPAGNVNEIRCLSEPDQAQFGPAEVRLELSTLRLAKNDPGRFLRERAVGAFLSPVLRVRRRMRIGKV